MELLQLRYFHEVVKLGSITKAAQSMHVSQPSLSQTIRRLEKEIGVDLFEKRGRNIVLTAYGHNFHSRIANALYEIENATVQMNPTKLQGHITIGSYLTLQPIMPCIKEFAAHYPDVSFTFLHVSESSIVNMARMDALLHYEQSNTLNFHEHIYITSAERRLALPAENADPNKTHYTLKELQDFDFISLLYNNEDYEEIYDEFSHARIHPRIRYRTNSSLLKQELIESGLGVGFSNDMLLDQMQNTGNYVRAQHTLDIRPVKIYMAWRSTGILSSAAAELKRFIMQRFDGE